MVKLISSKYRLSFALSAILSVMALFPSCSEDTEYVRTGTESTPHGHGIVFSIRPVLDGITSTRAMSGTRTTETDSLTIAESPFSDGVSTRGAFNGLTLLENDNFNEQVKELTVYAIKDGDSTPFYDGVVLENDGNGNFDYKDAGQAKDWPDDGKAITFYVATSGVLSCSGTTVTTNVSTDSDQLYFKSEGLTSGVVDVQLKHLCGLVYFQATGTVPDGVVLDSYTSDFTEGKWVFVKPGSHSVRIRGYYDNLKLDLIRGEYQVGDSHWDKVIKILFNKSAGNVTVEPGMKYNVTFNKGNISVMTEYIGTLADGDVDMGTSVKWCSKNLGADTPTDYGDYYAWGETTPRTGSSWYYDYDSDCPYWGSGTSYLTSKWSKYTGTLVSRDDYSSTGSVDGKKTLEASDDAATVQLGSPYRMPTSYEFYSLRNNNSFYFARTGRTTNHGSTSQSGYTSNNGISLVLANSSNKNCIIFPEAGFRTLDDYNAYTGNYWSSSLYEDSPYFSMMMSFHFSADYTYFFNWSEFGSRCYGYSVRPVRP